MNIYPVYKSKYERWYYSIINNAKCQYRIKSKLVYYELHHIIPLSLNGPDIQENTVLLTAREHFICHWLLYKFCKGNDKHKMAHALFMMCNVQNDYQTRYFPSSKIYEAAKKAKSLIEVSDETRKKQSQSQLGKNIPHKTREKISESMKKITKSEEHRKNLSNSLKGKQKTPDHVKAMANSKRGKKWSEEQKKKLKENRHNKGESNPIFSGWYVTPWGSFSTPKLAADSAPFVITENAIRKYCKYLNSKIITNNHPINAEYVGKTPNEIGYSFKIEERSL